MKIDYSTLDYKAMTETEQIMAVKLNSHNIQHIENPSEAVQVKAVKQNAWAIQHIKNPSEAVCMAAVEQDGWAIQDIENPSEAVQIAAVGQDGQAIEIINNPSEAVCIMAVKSDYKALNFIPWPVSDTVAATHLLYHPLYLKTPKEILDRAPEILEAYCSGLGDVYTIGMSMNMTDEELSKTLIEWADSHRDMAVGAEMAP